ncbi:MAG: GNAT family N-acetyltransferase, partial [Verrucomicrobiota bacterium]
FRLLVLGVRERFRGRGIEAALFAATLQRARQLGYRRCAASWVLEDNEPVHRLAALFQGRIHRRFRIYQRDL